MTRIVAGTARGRRLATPPGRDTRPTTDRVREALFGSLTAELGGLESAAFLDLYAGSGAIGLEALSRGATPVVLVEHDRHAIRTIRRNLTMMRDLPGAVLAGADVERLVAEPPRPTLVPGPNAFDAVFLDPPYGLPSERVESVLAALVANRWLADPSTVIVERASRDAGPTWPVGLAGTRCRRYGDTTLWYGRYEGRGAACDAED